MRLIVKRYCLLTEDTMVLEQAVCQDKLLYREGPAVKDHERLQRFALFLTV